MNAISGKLVSKISDHLPQLLIVDNIKVNCKIVIFFKFIFILQQHYLQKGKKKKKKKIYIYIYIYIYIQYTTLLTLLTKIYSTQLKHYKSCTIYSYLRVLYSSFPFFLFFFSLNFLRFPKGEKPVPIKV